MSIDAIEARIPEPATRFPKIDGAGVTYAAPPKPTPKIVQGDMTPDSVPQPRALQTVLLLGGPMDMQEARVWRKAKEHRVTVPRVNYAPRPEWPPDVPGQKPSPKIVQGDFDQALYLRTDEKDDEGRIIFEYQG